MAHIRLSALYAAFETGDQKKHTEILLRGLRAGQSDIVSDIHTHALSDEWLDFAIHGLKDHFHRSRGYIYVARPGLDEGMLKIGKTAANPDERLKQLNNESVLHPFSLVGYLGTHDRHWCERQLHLRLKLLGVQHRKEFFQIDASVALSIAAEISRQDRERLKRIGLYLFQEGMRTTHV